MLLGQVLVCETRLYFRIEHQPTPWLLPEALHTPFLCGHEARGDPLNIKIQAITEAKNEHGGEPCGIAQLFPSLTQNGLQILVGCGNRFDIEVLDQRIQDIWA